MALSLKFCVTENSDCSTISVRETTGAYSAGNTGGWGAPNPTIASATSATIVISKRNTDGTYATAYDTINAYSTLPNITNVEFDITAEDVGLGEDSVFSDGIYKIVYTVSGNSGGAYTATKTFYKVIKCTAKCCYQELADQVSTCSCGCDDLEAKFNTVSTYYRLLQGAECCANLDAIQTYLTKIQNLCGECGCCG